MRRLFFGQSGPPSLVGSVSAHLCERASSHAARELILLPLKSTRSPPWPLKCHRTEDVWREHNDSLPLACTVASIVAVESEP
eukprot:scaffold181424_cov28-Tisochrysis_lutea.AAC.3